MALDSWRFRVFNTISGGELARLHTELQDTKDALEKAEANALGWSEWAREYQIKPGEVTAETYYQVYKKHPLTRGVIDKIADVCTATGYLFVPRFEGYRLRVDEARKLQAFFQTQKFILLLRRWYKDILIFGDAYLHKRYTGKRQLYGFRRVAPQTMRKETDEHGDVIRFFQEMNGKPVAEFKPYEIVHFMLDDPGNDIYGLAKIESLVLTTAQDLYAQAFNAKFFEHGAHIPTVISLKNAGADEVLRARKWIKEDYEGYLHAFKPLVVSDAQVERMGETMAEMQYMEGRKVLRHDEASVFGIPPEKVGFSEAAGRAVMAEIDKNFREELIVPLQTIFEVLITEEVVVPDFGIWDIVFRHAPVDTRDNEALMETRLGAVKAGCMSINEWRAMYGYPPTAGGDKCYIMTPTGAIPVDSLEQYYRLPEPAEPGEQGEGPETGAQPPEQSATGPESADTVRRPRRGSKFRPTGEA